MQLLGILPWDKRAHKARKQGAHREVGLGRALHMRPTARAHAPRDAHANGHEARHAANNGQHMFVAPEKASAPTPWAATAAAIPVHVRTPKPFKGRRAVPTPTTPAGGRGSATCFGATCLHCSSLGARQVDGRTAPEPRQTGVPGAMRTCGARGRRLCT